jgi:hypothetical protein
MRFLVLVIALTTIFSVQAEEIIVSKEMQELKGLAGEDKIKPALFLTEPTSQTC